MIVVGPRHEVHIGESLAVLRTMPSDSVDCIVTSPPYWQLRDYGHEDQLGLEETPELFVERLTEIMSEARRVLSPRGTCWVNLGDTYTGGRMAPGLKPKELVGIPWRVAFALQSDGWWLRSEIIWRKPSAMPESVRDRPSRDHEHIFLLTKSRHYHYDADAIRTPLKPKTFTAHGSPARIARTSDTSVRAANWARSKSAKRVAKTDGDGNFVGANARSVWTIAQEPWTGQHTSTFPRRLARRCILAGCPVGGTVLDPFVGTGTTIAVALEHGRSAIGIDVSPSVLPEIEARLSGLQLTIPEARCANA